MKINTDTNIVPNWFNRQQLSDTVVEKVSKEDFQAFKNHINNSDFPDEISELIRTEFEYWKKHYKGENNES